jgi:hypothetical protein
MDIATRGAHVPQTSKAVAEVKAKTSGAAGPAEYGESWIA